MEVTMYFPRWFTGADALSAQEGLIIRLGRSLYGDRWQGDMAVALAALLVIADRHTDELETVIRELRAAREDTLGRWIEECCVVARVNWQAGDDLWSAWKGWAECHHERPGTRIRFGRDMIERGFAGTKQLGTRGHQGIALREL